MSNSTANPSGPAAALQDYRWFPEMLDPATGEVTLVKADRPTLSGQPFLDERWLRKGQPRERVSRAHLNAYLAGQPTGPSLNFIWHTAFCCSTAIAHALDRPGHNLSLREPAVLVTLANLARTRPGPGANPQPDMRAVFRLLGRPSEPEGTVTLKPTNAANRLVREAATLTSGKMLFLYSDCRSFLISLSKRSEQGRAFGRRLFAMFAPDGHEQHGWPMENLFVLTDLQIAALVWHMQIGELLRAMTKLGNGRAVSLDCDAFLASPAETLAKLDAYFGYGLGPEHIEAAINGPVLNRDAKDPGKGFAPQQRADEQRAISGQIGGVLDQIVAWSYEVCKATPRGTPLPDPIMRLDKPYHR